MLYAIASPKTSAQISKKMDNKMHNLIFLFETEVHQCNNNGHLQNFIKYLFSISKDHPYTEDSWKNFCQFKSNSSNKIITTNISDKSSFYNDFKNTHWNSFNYLDNYDTIVYPYFILNVNGKWISNLIKITENTIMLSDSVDDYVAAIISDTTRYEHKLLMDFLAEHNPNKILDLYSLQPKDVWIIDQIILNEDTHRNLDEEPLIRIFHHDQDIHLDGGANYHFHKLM